jgi:hypothetical protein
MTSRRAGTATVVRRVYTALAGAAGAIAILVTMTIITQDDWPIQLVGWIFFPFTYPLYISSVLVGVITGTLLGNELASFVAPLIIGVIFAVAGNLQFRIVEWMARMSGPSSICADHGPCRISRGQDLRGSIA